MDFLLSAPNNNDIQHGNCRVILKIGNGESENGTITNEEREIFRSHGLFMKKRKENELFSLTATRQELGGTRNRADWGYPHCVWTFILVKKQKISLFCIRVSR